MNERRNETKSDAIVSFVASIDWARSGFPFALAFENKCNDWTVVHPNKLNAQFVIINFRESFNQTVVVIEFKEIFLRTEPRMDPFHSHNDMIII